jgi:hypothetical protein
MMHGNEMRHFQKTLGYHTPMHRFPGSGVCHWDVYRTNRGPECEAGELESSSAAEGMNATSFVGFKKTLIYLMSWSLHLYSDVGSLPRNFANNPTALRITPRFEYDIHN